MNQSKCKQVKSTVVLGFKTAATGIFTGAVEKSASFRAETTVQLWTSRQSNAAPART